MAYATGDHRAALFVSGMALMSMVLVLVGLAEFFTKERRYV
jgi:phosphate transport system permease protein